jgi:hypothetical protein
MIEANQRYEEHCLKYVAQEISEPPETSNTLRPSTSGDFLSDQISYRCLCTRGLNPVSISQHLLLIMVIIKQVFERT